MSSRSSGSRVVSRAVRFGVLVALTLGTLVGSATAAWGALGVTIGPSGPGHAPVRNPGGPGGPGSSHPGSVPPGNPTPPPFSVLGTQCLSSSACSTIIAPNPSGYGKGPFVPPPNCQSLPIVANNFGGAICVTSTPPTPSIPSTSVEIGYNANSAQVYPNTWTITYPNQQGVSTQYTFGYAFGTPNQSPYIEAYCDGYPVTGTVSYTITLPPPSYRNPPSGWNWSTPPPGSPQVSYVSQSFTTRACSSARQTTDIQGVSLKPSPTPAKAPTVSNDDKIVTDGTFHTFYFQPTPVCPASDPKCGVDTTLIWQGGTATMGEQTDPAGAAYSPNFTGFGGQTIPRWQLFPGIWGSNSDENQIVSGTHSVSNVPSCGTSQSAPTFDEPCVSVSLHSPSNRGNPYQLSLSGSYVAVWSNYYFTVSLTVTPTETQSQLPIYKNVPGYYSCKKRGRDGKYVWGCYVPPTRVWGSPPVTWYQPSLSSSTDSASGLTPNGAHISSILASTTGYPGSASAQIAGVSSVLSGSSTF